MQGQPCPFGQVYFQTRTANSISQWTVALRAQYHIRNIQRIERGEHQPGVMLALRLVAATNVNVGDFFALLASFAFQRKNPQSTPKAEKTPPVQPKYEKAQLEGVKCLFGPLIHQARLAAEISQAEVAQKVQYNLRNVGAVEKGKQEPGVMVALGMVTATEANVETFFNMLHELASAR